MNRLTTVIIGTFLDLSGILHCLKGSERMPQMGQVGSAENCGCSSRIMAMQFILAAPGCFCVLFLRSAGAAALSRGRSDSHEQQPRTASGTTRRCVPKRGGLNLASVGLHSRGHIRQLTAFGQDRLFES